MCKPGLDPIDCKSSLSNIFAFFPNFYLNLMNLRVFFKKKTVSKWVVLQKIGNLLGISKIICLNCKEGGEGSTKIQNVSIKDVSIELKGGTGKAN